MHQILALKTFRRLCGKTSSESATLPIQRAGRSTAAKATVPSSAGKANLSSVPTSESESDEANTEKKKNQIKNLPPRYDSFSKDRVTKEPSDPRNPEKKSQGMKSDWLVNNAVKMLQGLAKDGMTKEVLDMYTQLKRKGEMPEVVVHTAAIEAYANAGGQSKEALQAFKRMRSCGVAPNAYTYAVLIKGLAADGKMEESMKYVKKMMQKKLKPNAETYTVVAEKFVREMKAEEGRKFFEEVKALGFVADEVAVKKILKSRRGQVVRGIMNILFGATEHEGDDLQPNGGSQDKGFTANMNEITDIN